MANYKDRRMTAIMSTEITNDMIALIKVIAGNFKPLCTIFSSKFLAYIFLISFALLISNIRITKLQNKNKF